jgi:hypothetical protein
MHFLRLQQPELTQDSLLAEMTAVLRLALSGLSMFLFSGLLLRRVLVLGQVSNVKWLWLAAVKSPVTIRPLTIEN